MPISSRSSGPARQNGLYTGSWWTRCHMPANAILTLAVVDRGDGRVAAEITLALKKSASELQPVDGWCWDGVDCVLDGRLAAQTAVTRVGVSQTGLS